MASREDERKKRALDLAERIVRHIASGDWLYVEADAREFSRIAFVQTRELKA